MTAAHDDRRLDLFPRPRRVVRGGGWVAGGPGPVAERRDPALPAQGYRLVVGDGGIRLDHADDAGLRYGRATLEEIQRQSPAGLLPAVTVEDHPDFPVRAYMLDVSRDRVPTRETLERFVGLLARARYNQFQLYVEHTFAHPGHERVWRHASPLTPQDMTWLDDRCAAHGIELVANQNCFGHMERWLAHDAYRHRAETPDGYDLLGVHRPPTVLAPTRDNAAFAHALLGNLLPHLHSRQVHIGCDETFELGRGASRADAEAQGLGRVYVDHVIRLARPLVDAGYRVQVWADVLRRHPDLAAELPPGTIPVAWCYEAPRAADAPSPIPAPAAAVMEQLGVDADAFAGFAPNVAPLVAAGVPFWVAPGTSAWNSLVGRIDNARANLVDAAAVGRRHGAGGYLVTDWGDNGHHQPPSISFGPLLHGGAVAWCLDTNRDLDVAAALDGHAFADAAGKLGPALDRLGRQWARTGRPAVNASPLHAALFPDQLSLVFGRPDPEQVRDVVAHIDRALGDVAAADPRCPDGPLVVAEITQAARLARLGAHLLLGPHGPPAAELAAERADLVEGQRRTWLARSRPGGLPDSLARLTPPTST